MPQAYSLKLDGKEYTHDSGLIAQISYEEHRDKKRVTTLQAEFLDPQWALFGKIKDPAFSNVPVELYLSKAGQTREQKIKVFDGKLTALAVGYPDRRTLTVTAHDKSIDARRQKTFKVFKGKHGVHIAESIAKAYDLEIDASDITSLLGNIKTREVDIGLGPNLSDWDHMVRALAADGFTAHVRHSKLIISQSPSVRYATTFYRDRFPVVSLNVTVNHVRGPGKGGDVRGTTWMDGQGTAKAVKGSDAKEAAKESAGSRTHRRPIGGAATSTAGAHSEDLDGNKPENTVAYLRKRKDQAQMVLLASPDLTVMNNVMLSGWGGKVDGTWFLETVRHQVSGDGGAMTTVGMMRGASSGAKKGANL